MTCNRWLYLCAVLLSGCTGQSPLAPTTPAAPAATTAAAAVTLTPNNWDLPQGGGSLTLTVATSGSASGNVPAGNVPVALSTSSGTLSSTELHTDSTGHASVVWTGATAATVTARAGEVLTTATIRVSVPQPTPPASLPRPPAPTPGPTPSPILALDVNIVPSARLVDAATPVVFASTVQQWVGPACQELYLCGDSWRLAPVVATTYFWDFGDGSTSTSATPTHLFRPANNWNVVLIATAADGRSGRGTIAIIVGAVQN